MRNQKLLITALLGIGVIAQFLGVSQVMKPVAEVMAMYGMLHISKICYLAVLAVFRYRLARHPYYPTWVGPILFTLTTCWMIYYTEIESGDPTGWLKYLVWGICYLLEYVCAIAFIVSSSRMLTEARKRNGHYQG